MREQLVAWAGDCRVRGEVDLGDGRLSDEINGRLLLMFFGATLEALEDGHEVAMDELEVERNELHWVEVEGRRGDPSRRLRTIPERVRLELGPYTVTGDLHRSPSAHSMAALASWAHFVPVTGALVSVAGRDGDPLSYEVVLVNRGRVKKYEPLDAIPVFADEGDTIPAPEVSLVAEAAVAVSGAAEVATGDAPEAAAGPAGVTGDAPEVAAVPTDPEPDRQSGDEGAAGR